MRKRFHHDTATKTRRQRQFESLEPRFVLDSTVVFNELMYNPGGVDESREWIELRNQLAVDMDLTGWRIRGGVDYDFPAGTKIPADGYLVIAANPTALGLPGALGPYTGQLSNGGEEVHILNNSDRELDRVDYGDNDPWPVGADGSGSSLAKIDEFWSAEDIENWRVSSQPGGTPGTANFPTVDLTPTTTRPVTMLSNWRYNDTNTDLGVAWRDPNYVDSAWSQGRALLYAGNETANLPPLGLRFLPISNDADSGIASNKSYTHKVDFGTTDTGAIINGVTFNQATGSNSASIPNFAMAQSTGIFTTSCPNTAPANVTGNLLQLMQDSVCNVVYAANGTVTITLSGLTVGAHYDTRLYTRQPTATGTRNTNVQFDTNLDGTPESNSLIDQNNATGSPPGFAAANQAYAISYDFIATNTAMRLRIVQPQTSNPWVVYGLTNEAVGPITTSTAIATLYSTGLGDSGTPLAPGTTDPHWFVTSTQAPILAMNGHPAWLPNSSTSQWAGMIANGADNVAAGNYSFSTRFDLSAYDAATAAISMRIGVDDSLSSVRLNGVTTSITTSGFAALNGPFTLNSGFVAGINTLEFNFLNGGVDPNPSGLRVELTGTAIPRLNNTLVAQGPITHYFRQEFNYAGNAAYNHALELSAFVDDGAVFYLNGQEIYRHNMPAGAINFTTAASTNVTTATQTPRISVPASALVVGGRNVLAVEVHQSNGGNTDVRFGAELFVTETPVPPEDLPKLVVNEMAAATDATFFIELRNEDDTPINLGGYTLRKFGAADATYVFPAQTLNPGQYLSINESQLTFDAVDGDRFILSSATQQVIDGRVVTPRLRGRSLQHDGRWLYPNLATPGLANSFAFDNRLVINEIMYHHQPNYGSPGTPGTFQTSTLLPIAANWRYNQSGVSPGPNWQASAHAVGGAWSSGPALLGFESAALSEPIRTPLTNPQTTNPFVIAYYFETEFTYNGNPTDPAEELLLRHLIDDGAVFYLNGQEIARFRMADGTPDAGTFASESTGDAASVGPIVVPKSALINGTNRLSVEVHQQTTNSSDIVFGAELTTRRTLTPLVPGTPFTESGEEWIELYNRGATAVNLTDWKINGGIDFDFAPGTLIQPGEYVLVAKDAVALAAKYPTVRILGSFSGELSNHDDLIRLDDAFENPADEVHYFESGEWSDLADGNGSSLELRDLDSDNAKGASWAASSESQAATWQTITYRGPANPGPGTNDPSNWQEFIFNLLDAGGILVDDVSVIEDPSGTAIQRIQNGSFTSGANTWRLVGNHGQHNLSGVIPEPGNPGNNVLHIVATSAGEHMSNHVETTFAGGASIVNGREYEISLRVKWISGSPQFNTRLYFNRLSRTTILNTPQNNGTPGAINSRAVANIGPTYAGLIHGPVIPQPNQPTTISVSAADPDGVATMNVKYAVAGGAFQTTAMTLGPDGIYRGVIPGQSASAIVQFYVEGTDTLGAVSTYPAAGPNSRALFKVNDNAATTGPRHNFRVIMTTADNTLQLENTNHLTNHRLGATVIFGERQVYYDAGIRLKGSGFSRGSNATGYNIRFAPDAPFTGVHEIVAIDRQGGPWGIGASHRELIIKHIANAAGDIPMMYDDVINFIAPNPAFNGSAQLLTARYEDEFTSTQFDQGEDGTRYKYDLIYYPTTTVDGNVQSLKLQPSVSPFGVDIQNMGDDENNYRYNFMIRNNRAADDYTQIIELGKTLSLSGSTVGGALDTRSRAIMDIDEWMRLFAFESLAGINDTYNQGLPHNLQLYVRPDDGRVLAFPWDMDFALHHGATSLGIYGSGSNLRKVIDIPSNQRLFQGHLLDIINTTYNTTYLTPWVNHFATRSVANDSAAILQYVTDRRNYVLSQLMPQVPFTITTNGGADFNVATGTVALAGNGWINVRDIRLAGNSSPLDVTWTDQDSWVVTLPLSVGANPITLVAYDFQGNPIAGATDSITVTTSFVSPDPLLHLRITELMYHPADPTAAELAAGFTDADEFEFIEFRNISDGPLNLSGLEFANGIEFNFSTDSTTTTLDAGEYLVITENRDAFNFRYGNPPITIAGQYAGRLDNGGERIRLENSAGTAVHDFVYDDTGATWHPSTDGAGHSLVILDPAGNKTNWGQGTGWRASFEVHGSPGDRDLMAGDFTLDDRIGLDDLSFLQSRLGMPAPTRRFGDLNGNHVVDRGDLAVLVGAYGRQFPIVAPSPSPAPAAVVVPTNSMSSSRPSNTTLHANRHPATVSLSLPSYRADARIVASRSTIRRPAPASVDRIFAQTNETSYNDLVND